jgi:hypothetical protein
MRTFIRGLFIVAVLVAAPLSAHADSWIFGPSTYSTYGYMPPIQQQVPTASRGPYFHRPPGYSVNSGYRNIRGYIRVGGQVFEQMNIWESWIQPGGTTF